MGSFLSILSRSTDALLIIGLLAFALFNNTSFSTFIGVCVAVNVIIFVRLAKRLLFHE